MGVVSGSRSSVRRHVYGCTRYHKTGLCRNGLRVPIERVDLAVLNAIGEQVLPENVVQAIVARVTARLAPDIVTEDVTNLRSGLQAVDREIRHLTNAIASGGQLESLLDELRAREKRRDSCGRRSTIDTTSKTRGVIRLLSSLQ